MNTSREHILIGIFLLSVIAFYFIPAFGSGKMVYFRYLLDAPETGADLSQMVGYSRELSAGRDIYLNKYGNLDRNIYPPMATVFFSPFTAMAHKDGYALISFLTLAAMFLLYLQSPQDTLSLIIFGIGTIAYGMQFEIERGQWNVIALCFAVYALKFWKKNLVLGMILFTVAIQLKLWPALFVLMLGMNEWKNVAILGAVNIALLFSLGWGTFTEFIAAMMAYKPDVWIGNHSIYSFTQLSDIPSWPFYAFTVGAIGWAYFTKRLNLLGCTIGTMLIPSASHDYKLTLLALPVSLFLEKRSLRIVIPISILFSITAFSFATRPIWIMDSCLILVGMLALATFAPKVRTV